MVLKALRGCVVQKRSPLVDIGSVAFDRRSRGAAVTARCRTPLSLVLLVTKLDGERL